jgi:hypothetical protein
MGGRLPRAVWVRWKSCRCSLFVNKVRRNYNKGEERLALPAKGDLEGSLFVNKVHGNYN